MYAETDFLLALIKDEDWLGDSAEAVYRTHRDELWTSEFTVIELLVIAYREERRAKRVVANAAELVDVRGDEQKLLAAATYVDDHGFTPFDAIHLVESGTDPIVSSDDSYVGYSERVDGDD